jgi:hypothetical protein
MSVWDQSLMVVKRTNSMVVKDLPDGTALKWRVRQLGDEVDQIVSRIEKEELPSRDRQWDLDRSLQKSLNISTTGLNGAAGTLTASP